MGTRMSTSTVERALHRVGERLEFHADVEILLVGGAAGMVTGVLRRDRTTSDCHVMVAVPEDALVAVEAAAAAVADEMDLPPRWLNSDVRIRIDALPRGWEQRKVPVCSSGRLRVFAASRPDLLAMKVLAGRDQDVEDLAAMRVREDDVAFVTDYLDELAAGGTPARQVERARSLLDALEVHDHE